MPAKKRATGENIVGKTIAFRLTESELKALGMIADRHNQKLLSLGMAPIASLGSVCRSLVIKEATALGFLEPVVAPPVPFESMDSSEHGGVEEQPKTGGSEDPPAKPVLSRHERAMRNAVEAREDIPAKPVLSRHERAMRNAVEARNSDKGDNK